MSSPRVVIRPARRDDLTALSALLVTQLRDHDNEVPEATLVDAARGLFERPQRGRFLVAEVDGVVIGFAALSYLWTLERGGRAAWLDELYVRPARRGGGLGQALLDGAIAAAAADGAVAVDLEIVAGHERVESLYRRNGFRPEARRHWSRILAPAAATVPAPPPTSTGGCCCGAIRYRIAGPPSDVTHCHCRLCQRSSGAPVVTWLTVPAAAVEWLSGTPRQRRSSSRAVRGFCADCGTALTFAYDDQPASIDVTVASLDNPAAIARRAHIWTASAMPWLRLDDDLARFEEERGAGEPVSR
jgi:GNAT superfamily N-acetyltransferase